MSGARNLKGMGEELLQLRSGQVSLAQLRPALAPHLGRLASYWHTRYRKKQTLLEVADLVSVGEVAVWRAVDTWDPARRPIGDYVLCAVGRAMEKELKAAAGWPDPRRPAPARQVYFSEVSACRSKRGGEAQEVRCVERAMEGVNGGLPLQPLQERYLEAKERAAAALQRVSDGLGRILAELVLKGYTIAGAAALVYESPRLRRYYGLRDVAHAERVAAAAARRVQRGLEGAAVHGGDY